MRHFRLNSNSGIVSKEYEYTLEGIEKAFIEYNVPNVPLGDEILCILVNMNSSGFQYLDNRQWLIINTDIKSWHTLANEGRYEVWKRQFEAFETRVLDYRNKKIDNLVD